VLNYTLTSFFTKGAAAIIEIIYFYLITQLTVDRPPLHLKRIKKVCT